MATKYTNSITYGGNTYKFVDSTKLVVTIDPVEDGEGFDFNSLHPSHTYADIRAAYPNVILREYDGDSSDYVTNDYYPTKSSSLWGIETMYFSRTVQSDTIAGYLNWSTIGILSSPTTPVVNKYTTSDIGPIGQSPTFNQIYPVGSIYMSVSPTNPSTYFGGTWVAWGSGRVPVGVDGNNANFSTIEKTGGATTHSHTTSSHQLTANECAVPSHIHDISHTHTLPEATIDGGACTAVGGITWTNTDGTCTIASSELYTGYLGSTATSNSHSTLSGGNHRHACAGSGCAFVRAASNATIARYSYGGSSRANNINCDSTMSVAANTDYSASHSHTITGHTHTINHRHDMSHGHTVPNHAHTVPEHSHSVPNHSHTFTCGDIVTANRYQSSAASIAATEAHSHGDTGSASTLQPYITCYMWKRTA